MSDSDSEVSTLQSHSNLLIKPIDYPNYFNHLVRNYLEHLSEWSGSQNIFSFTVNDQNGFLLEFPKTERSSYANFNHLVCSKTLKDVFDEIWYSLPTLSFK